MYGGVSKEDVKYLGKDIRFIKSESGKLNKVQTLLVSKRIYYSSFIAALFIFLTVLFIRREHVRRNADLSKVRNRKAGKVASKRLREAAVCLKNNQTDKFYEEILKALWGYLSDKLSIPVAEMTRSRIVMSLSEKGIDEQTIAELNQILDTCEFARFAPTSSETQAASLYEEASGFIGKVENSIS